MLCAFWSIAGLYPPKIGTFCGAYSNAAYSSQYRVLAEKHAEAKAADLQVFNEAIDAASASDDE
jgi:hypothetical protein